MILGNRIRRSLLNPQQRNTMNGIDFLPLAVGHMIGLGAIGSCIGVGLMAIVIGLINVKDFFALKRGITLSIPESAKPGIYERVRKIVGAKYLSVAIGASVVLAMLVNVVELLCTAGLPAVYTQILSQQHLPIWKNYAYLALYNLAYMFDDGLMVGTFLVTLSHRKMREDEGRWLKLISGGVVLALGFTVLFKPEWLQWGGS